MSWPSWQPWQAQGAAEPTWVVLTNDGLEIAGSTLAAPTPVHHGPDISSRSGLVDIDLLGPVATLLGSGQPDAPAPAAVAWPFPIAFLATTGGLITWTAASGPVALPYDQVAALAELRPGSGLWRTSDLTRALAAAFAAADLARPCPPVDGDPLEAEPQEAVSTPAAGPASAVQARRSRLRSGAARVRRRRRARARLVAAPDPPIDEPVPGEEPAGGEPEPAHPAGGDATPVEPVGVHGLPVWSATCATDIDGNPLALGMIMSAIHAHDGGALAQRVDLRPIRLRPDDVLDEVAVAAQPGILFTSNYLWTLEPNLSLAEGVKERSPDTLVIFGGPSAPSYPERVAAFLDEHPQVDVLVHGEGEATAREIVAAWSEAPDPSLEVLASVAGLSYRVGDQVHRTEDRARLTDLDMVPSPYLTGLFDHLSDQPGMWSVESNRGCPYACTFCDWGAATRSRIRKFDLDRVKAELTWIAEHQIHTLMIADANFGIFERDVEIATYLADLKATHGFPRSVVITFAKNTVKHTLKITRILEEAGLSTEATISFQTTDQETLTNVRRRNIKLEAYETLALDARRQGLPILADLMLGLPGSNMASMRADLQTCFRQDVSARMFGTLVLENSPMNEPDYRTLHGIETDEFHQLVAAKSFSEDDRDEMILFRNAFRFADHFGSLRHVLRFVGHELGLEEIDVFVALHDAVVREPGRYPTLHFSFVNARRYLTPTIGWPALLAEARQLIIDQHGLDPAAGLDQILRAQDALLPVPGRPYPLSLEFDFGVVGYLRQFLDPDHHGTLRPLQDFPASTLQVSDPDGVALRGIYQPNPPQLNASGHALLLDEFGWNEDNNWELASPLARVIRERYTYRLALDADPVDEVGHGQAHEDPAEDHGHHRGTDHDEP